MKKLLVPVDFSADMNASMRYGLCLAGDLHCKLFFFHCSSTLIPTRGTQDAYRAAVREDIEKKEKDLMSKLTDIRKRMDLTQAMVEVEIVVVHGNDIAANLLRTAREKVVDLVVMSTHSASGLKKMFFGTITVKTIVKSPVPVLAIPARFKYQRPKKIVYSTDLQSFDDEFSRVRILAGLLQTELEVLSFNHPAPVKGEERVRLHNAGIGFTVKSIDDMPLIDHLNSYLNNKPGHILCMFTHGLSTLQRVFNKSNTAEVAMDLQFPLLALRKKKELIYN